MQNCTRECIYISYSLLFFTFFFFFFLLGVGMGVGQITHCVSLVKDYKGRSSPQRCLCKELNEFFELSCSQMFSTSPFHFSLVTLKLELARRTLWTYSCDNCQLYQVIQNLLYSVPIGPVTSITSLKSYCL